MFGKQTKNIKNNANIATSFIISTLLQLTDPKKLITHLRASQRTRQIEPTSIQRQHYIDTSKIKYRRISTPFRRTFFRRNVNE